VILAVHAIAQNGILTKCTGIVDSSGIRFFYTDQSPEQNAAFLPIGHDVVGHMIIPPHVERYTVNGYCSQRCTNAVSIATYYVA